MKKIKELLDKEIEKLRERLQTLEPDSDEYRKVEDAMNKLIEKRFEIEKLKGDKWSRAFKIACDIAAILLPLGVNIGFVLLMFTFEEKGTISSSMGRKIMDLIMKKRG